MTQIDFESEVRRYLTQKGYVRRRELIAYLQKTHKNELGYSLKSINRKLYNLIKQGAIISLKFPDFKKLGIEDTDQKASYLTLKNVSKIKEHMDEVLKRLESGDPIKQKIALKEIARYNQMYVLTPRQLDLVVAQFEEGIDNGKIKTDLANKLLDLLYTYVLKKGIEPTNKTKTINLLEKLLNKYPIPVSTHINIRTYIIHLLGRYEHKAVIDRFIKDVKTLKDPYTVEKDYITEFTANIIEEHRAKLYELEEKLALEKKDEVSQFVSNIRTEALINLGLNENIYFKKKEER